MGDDNTRLAVRALLIAAKELENRDRPIDLQEHNIIWDVQEMLSEVIHIDLRFRLKTNSGVSDEPGA